jgi:hypothetical protein
LPVLKEVSVKTVKQMKQMKQITFWLGVILLIAACSTQKGLVKVVSNNGESIVEDSTEYRLETFDARFETWYQIHHSPAMYRSQQYYENWNRQYVSAWNYNAMSGRRNSFFEPIIGYEYSVDYGFDINHKLFYYFQYVEHVLNIQIMPGGPQAVFF